ncbi:acidic endochitinase [Selaginella moellendorffii]|nr:acidic endochitinase [Selaginella moellendorffii]|eukprot:XP_002975729.2 acidic endochitinase [Selaginella moellendorffii]
MAMFEQSKMLPMFLVILAVLAPVAPKASAATGSIAIYWGQNGNEGSLANACINGTYKIIMLSFLNVFGGGQIPQLNLAGHCDPSSNGCVTLSSQIASCQSKGIQILLSLGGAVGNYTISSASDARSVARYLWNNFLGGRSSSRPLGSAVLDGIDFDIENGAIPDRYALLAQAIRDVSRGSSRRVLISAAPQCPFPDANLGSAIAKQGLFDYVYVQFYNNPPCQYDGSSTTRLLDSWKEWNSKTPNVKIFMGLPAAPAAAGSGFVPSQVLRSQVLPRIRSSPKYGGVMFWSVFFDRQTSYSQSIKASI